MTITGRPADSETDAHDYERHRSDVLALLRSRFGTALNEADREDLYHEAWAGALERRRRGKETPDLLGLLKTIAFRRARDRLRNKSADPTDPVDGPLAFIYDTRPAPDEQVAGLLDSDLCRQLVDSLPERQRTILKLRCELELSPAEIQGALGISRKVYEKHHTKAVKAFAAALGQLEDGRWRAQQRELLLACEAGTASAEELTRARRLAHSDPAFRAMLRRARGFAALAPLAALWGRTARRLGTNVHVARMLRRGVSAPAPTTAGARFAGGASLAKLLTVSAVGASAIGGVTAGVLHEEHARRAPAHQMQSPSDVPDAGFANTAVSPGHSTIRPARAKRQPLRVVPPTRTPSASATQAAPPAAVPAPAPPQPVDRPADPSTGTTAPSTAHAPRASGDGGGEFGP